MAKYNEAISVTFNDNDGKAGWSANPIQAYDLHRHQVIFGKWRTRWILFKKFWIGLIWLEGHVKRNYRTDHLKLWKLKSEIPE